MARTDTPANGLTERERRFCAIYMDINNATQAYKQAGYTCKNDKVAGVEGHNLLKRPRIRAEISRLRDEMLKPNIMSIVARKNWLTGIMNDSEVSMKDRLKALDILNKMEGAYSEQLTIGGAGEGGALLIAWRTDKPPEAENVTTIESTE